MVNNKKNSFVSQIIYNITKNVSIKKYTLELAGVVK